MGDATNMVIIFAGELLKKAESLLVMGLHPSEVTKGYELALDKTLKELECASALVDCSSQDLVFFPLTGLVRSQYCQRGSFRSHSRVILLSRHSSPRSRRNNMAKKTYLRHWWLMLLYL